MQRDPARGIGRRVRRLSTVVAILAFALVTTSSPALADPATPSFPDPGSSQAPGEVHVGYTLYPLLDGGPTGRRYSVSVVPLADPSMFACVNDRTGGFEYVVDVPPGQQGGREDEIWIEASQSLVPPCFAFPSVMVWRLTVTTAEWSSSIKLLVGRSGGESHHGCNYEDPSPEHVLTCTEAPTGWVFETPDRGA